jgi:hypothetical protein
MTDINPVLVVLAWASRPSGFIWADGRGWVSVQECARRTVRENEGDALSASAQRLVDAVNLSAAWSESPSEIPPFLVQCEPDKRALSREERMKQERRGKVA